MNLPQVFQQRRVTLPTFMSWLLVVSGLVTAWLFWRLFETFPDSAAAKIEAGLTKRIGAATWADYAQMIGLPLFAFGFSYVQWRMQRDGRLVFDATQLSDRSSGPFLIRWIDWDLPLKCIRQGATHFVRAFQPLNCNSLGLVQLQWRKLPQRRLLVAHWRLVREARQVKPEESDHLAKSMQSLYKRSPNAEAASR